MGHDVDMEQGPDGVWRPKEPAADFRRVCEPRTEKEFVPLMDLTGEVTDEMIKQAADKLATLIEISEKDAVTILRRLALLRTASNDTQIGITGHAPSIKIEPAKDSNLQVEDGEGFKKVDRLGDLLTHDLPREEALVEDEFDPRYDRREP